MHNRQKQQISGGISKVILLFTLNQINEHSKTHKNTNKIKGKTTFLH